jgi:hypothetical protein
MHYLPNLPTTQFLSKIRRSQSIYILTGSGDYEDPNQSRRLLMFFTTKTFVRT